MRFRKRPIIVDAVQWYPPGDPRHDPTTPVSNPLARPVVQGTIVRVCYGPDVYALRTVDGPAMLVPGDWIITDEGGRKTRCASEEFDKTYDLV